MRALVTGGAGFIGSALVDRLVADGHTVDVVDDLSTGKMDNLAEARAAAGNRLVVHEVDIRTPEAVDAIASTGAEVVFHLAAQAAVPVSVAKPVFDAEVNVVGSLHVLEGARGAGARKVVYAASGGTIYGEPADDQLPATEALAQLPVSPYGVSKKVVVDYLRTYERLHGLAWAALALANVYGPRQDPHGEAGVVAIFAQRLLAGQRCTLFDAGRNTRDYVYVGDVADAFARAADTGSGLCNVGTGQETSTRELYDSMVAQAGVPPVEPELAPPRPGDIARSLLDPGRAGEQLGWTPSTTLVDGTARAFAYFRTRVVEP